MHVLDAKQFNPEEMGEIFELADSFKETIRSPGSRRELANKYTGEQIGSIFYESSTRTKGSFEIAAEKLGMGVYQTENGLYIRMALLDQAVSSANQD
jgi:aspartate carbamoyltransferase catalytic subunit